MVESKPNALVSIALCAHRMVGVLPECITTEPPPGPDEHLVPNQYGPPHPHCNWAGCAMIHCAAL